MAKWVGLTGGIGSGKSTVAALFASLGVPVIDTDQLSRELSAEGGAAIPAIIERFGESVIDADGGLDRGAMRSRVFSDPDARARLEAILHPLIGQEVERRAQIFKQHSYVLLEVPLLFESMRYRQRLLASVVVDCPVHLQVERVARRSQLGAIEISRIIDAQLPRRVRLQLADYVVSNSSSATALPSFVQVLHTTLLGRCAIGRADPIHSG